MPNNLPPGFQPIYFNEQVFSCRLAGNANEPAILTPSNNTNGVGTKVAEIGDRVLIAGQTAAEQNGIYVVTDLGSSTTTWVLTRAPDFCTLEQMSAGQYFTIEDGSSLIGTHWTLVRPLPNQINVDPIVFVKA